MSLTHKDFKTKLRRTIWVSPGESANLVAAHNIFFNEAMVEIAKWCLLNRQNNTSVIAACKTLVRCGLTVFDSPPTVDGPGVIRRVYSIANDDWCFPAGTMVTTARGQVPIEKLTTKDRVLTRKGFRRILWSGMTSAKAIVRQVRLEDGNSFLATPKHRIWTNENGWIPLELLTGAHTLLSLTTNSKKQSFAPLRVQAVTPLRCVVPVYDLTVEGESEFFTDGVLVHNCDTVFYEAASFRDVQCWSNHFRCAFTNPENAGLPALQQGFKYAESSTDSPNGRARLGMWAVERNRVYVAPWIQSNEKVVLEWDGWKQDWQDDDIVDEVIWGADIQAAIRTFVRWKHEDNFGCDLQKKRDLYIQFYGDGRDVEGELANLMYWDKKKREGDPVEDCTQRRLPTTAEQEDDVAPESAGDTSFAIIGDFGAVGTPTEQVADMVLGWKPEFILSTGDNWYDATLTKEDLDNRVGRYYSSYIGKYSGAYGTGASRQNFYATIGNHDRDPSAHLDIEFDYFGVADLQTVEGNIRPFYTVVRGPVQFFFVDAGFDNSQVNQQTEFGNNPTSAQAEWLRIGLLLSTAKWKVVVMHQPAYTSYHTAATQATLAGDGFLAYPDLRWPFKAWGADLVMNGHIHWYERLEVDGLPYIANGAGGKSIVTINGALSPYNKFIYDGDFGAQKCTVSCTSLKLEFWNRVGVLIEMFELTK